MRRMFTCALAAILLGTLTPSVGTPELPSPTAPQPKPGWYKALGGGARVICGSFVAEMQKGPFANQLFGNTVISWVHGFLTAYNEAFSYSPVVGGDLSQGLTEVEVINWVADYCGSHPDQVIADAAHEMIVYLYQRRANSNPNPQPQPSRQSMSHAGASQWTISRGRIGSETHDMITIGEQPWRGSSVI